MKSKINNNSTSKSPLYKPIFTIKSPNITYDEINHTIISNYQYQTSKINDKLEIHPTNIQLNFRTNTMIPKVGLMIVGIGGNNGTTLVASIEANRQNLTWETKDKTQQANYYGSITQASTVYMGMKDNDEKVYIPFHHLLPMINPNDLIISGWDISALNLKEAMKRAKVLDINLQQQLYSFMEEQTPLPGIYDPSFIAMNQMSRADNIITGNKKEQLDVIRTNIRDFKEKHNLEKVIVLWTANTERYCKVSIGVHDTIKNLLQGITNNESEISPSTLYAVASILEGCSFINGSPQNTLVPGVIELAKKYQVFIAGDDFKTGQTKLKSVLVDYLISAGIKPQAIVSYNHLGNNDGFNLSSYEQFQSKEISKSNVIDDMIKSNNILYSDNEHPDHCVVIKYVPHVGDSKRAIDEYTSEIFMGGKNTIIIHNTCEDSLLAVPIMIDLVILCELCERIQVKEADEESDYERFDTVLSLLSYLLKAPLVSNNKSAVNALYSQRQSIINIFRAVLSLPPENHMFLEQKIPFLFKHSN